MENPGTTGKVIAKITGWQQHLSKRIMRKIANFDQQIATFRQRRWS